MDEEHRENVRKANRRRASHLCRQCGQGPVAEKDGKECGGLPGITYRCCNVCGWNQAVTRKPRRADNPLFDRG